jgi:hypothetical protein
MTTAAIEQDAPTTEQLQEALRELAEENAGLLGEADDLKRDQKFLIKALADVCAMFRREHEERLEEDMVTQP